MIDFKKLHMCVVSKSTLHHAFCDEQVRSYEYLGETTFLKGYWFHLKDGSDARLYVNRYGGDGNETGE